MDLLKGRQESYYCTAGEPYIKKSFEWVVLYRSWRLRLDVYSHNSSGRQKERGLGFSFLSFWIKFDVFFTPRENSILLHLLMYMTKKIFVHSSWSPCPEDLQSYYTSLVLYRYGCLRRWHSICKQCEFFNDSNYETILPNIINCKYHNWDLRKCLSNPQSWSSILKCSVIYFHKILVEIIFYQIKNFW